MDSISKLNTMTPRDLQSLWLLSKHFANLYTANLEFLEENFIQEVTSEELQRLTNIGKALGLLEEFEQNYFRLTPIGNTFAEKNHWRFWEPRFPNANNLEIKKWFYDEKNYYARPTILDLFSGAGGLGLGFESAGFRIGIAIDKDKQACEAHEKNFPFSRTINDDVSELANDTVTFFTKHGVDQNIEIDGIIGGPPCQGFSYVGERMESDERNLLTSKFVDIVLAIKPKFFVIENVQGLLTSGLVPSFAKYIVRQSKTSSTLVSSIVNALPSSSAKRDRQFRRRLVSSCIKQVKNSIQLRESFILDVANFISLIEDIHLKLLGSLTQSIITKLDSTDLSAAVTCSTQLVKLAVALAVVNLLETQSLQTKHTQDFFERLIKADELPCNIRESLESILRQYVNAPSKATFGGVEVGPVLHNLIERLEGEYLVTPPQVLNAADFGAPQDRKRLFVVGIRKDLNICFTFPEPIHRMDSLEDCSKPLTTFDAIHDLPNVDELNQTQTNHQFNSEYLSKAQTDFVKQARFEFCDLSRNFSLCRPSWNPYIVDCSERVLHKHNVVERIEQLAEGAQDKVSRRTRLDRTKPSPTLRAGTKENKGSHTAVRPIHYEHNRVITVREGARLMGYPDWMTFHKTKWHGFRLVGNGVPFPLSNTIAARIMHLLYD